MQTIEEEKTAVPKEQGAVAGWPPNWMSPLAWRAWMRTHRPEYCKVMRSQAVGPYREHTDLPDGQFNRVAKPGDADYEGPQGQGTCKRCAKPTQSPLINTCYACATGHVEAV
jgi:hypothetical protein